MRARLRWLMTTLCGITAVVSGAVNLGFPVIVFGIWLIFMGVTHGYEREDSSENES